MTQTQDDGLAGEPIAVEQTGHQDIDAALQQLDQLDDLAITEHPEQFEAIHQVLRDSLADAGDRDVPDTA